MVIRVGMIGLSEGNGHPFSFSAIINGFDEIGMAESGWPGIHTYLKRRHPSEFGYPGVSVTHAWTQDADQTKALCDACRITNPVDDPAEFPGAVDAVIIARDDHERHWEMAQPFLEAGLPVFVDKPLSLDVDELRRFLPYATQGLLMSCSGMRYARELDELRAGEVELGETCLVRGVTVKGWDKYAIHMLDGIFGALELEPVSVTAHEADHESVAVATRSGAVVQIDALGEVIPVFQIDVFGTQGRFSCEVRDNFVMFRRTLWHFIQMVETGKPQVPEKEMLRPLTTLLAGDIAMREKRRVEISEVRL